MADSHQPIDPKSPDLEETTNVAEAHAFLLESGAAQAREKRLEESGMEPVSLWVFLASAVVLLVGGGVMGAGGKLFDYNPMPEGYVRADFDSGEGSRVMTGTMVSALMKRGEKIFASCAGCHGGGGEGKPGFPPLAGSEWVQGSSERMAMIVLNGLTGKITVKGQGYDGLMPAQAIGKMELAAVMTYVRNSFGNESGDIITPEQAGNAIKIAQERAGGASTYTQITVDELNANHDRMLEGAAIDPETMVNLETLEPVGDAAAAE
jgi:mono/diheme cytochrome c family protein